MSGATSQSSSLWRDPMAVDFQSIVPVPNLPRIAAVIAVGLAVLHASPVPAHAYSDCPRFSEPVCGKVPGQRAITYLNSCFAHEAHARIVYGGSCRTRRACSRINRPVCGKVRGQREITYVNRCIARSNGAKVLYRGRCEPWKRCSKRRRLVCGMVPGSRAITYLNACLARTQGARVLHKGRCTN